MLTVIFKIGPLLVYRIATSALDYFFRPVAPGSTVGTSKNLLDMTKSEILTASKLLLLSLGFIGLQACQQATDLQRNPEVDVEISAGDKISDTIPAEEKEKKEPRRLVTYQLDSLASQAEVDSFKTRYSEEEQKTIFALNRMDPWRLSKGDRIVIPDSLTADFLAYAPFPEELAILDSIPKAVLISRRVQAIALYDQGKLVRWGPASSGKQSSQTPAGIFYGNYKAREKVSTINSDWILPYYFNYMNFEGVGVHQYSLPGYPASHGCVRLRKEDAVEIYNWADQWELDPSQQIVEKNGTPFMVFGDYDFEGTPPWLLQSEDPKSNFINPEEMEILKEYVSEYWKNEKNFKKVLPEGELLKAEAQKDLQA